MDVQAMVDECEAVRKGHTYNLAASLIDVTQIEDVRDTVRALRPPGAAKLHWHDTETARERLELVQAVAEMRAVEHVVVVLDGHAAARAERRRRLCLGPLLLELGALGVENVLIEAREESQNMRDRKLLDGLRAQKRIPKTLRMHHKNGPGEPALAVADIVCGAVLAAFSGEDRYRKVIEHKLTERVVSA